MEGCALGKAVLIHFEGHDHFEDGDIDLEDFFGVEVFHIVGAIHFAKFGAQVAAADILVPLSWTQSWL
jgi:hypothetical protein